MFLDLRGQKLSSSVPRIKKLHTEEVKSRLLSYFAQGLFTSVTSVLFIAVLVALATVEAHFVHAFSVYALVIDAVINVSLTEITWKYIFWSGNERRLNLQPHLTAFRQVKIVPQDQFECFQL